MDQAEFNALRALIWDVWPDPTPARLEFELLSQKRNAEHWRVRRGSETVVVRSTESGGPARRIIAALTSLEGETFAPRLLGWTRMNTSRYLIAMEDMGERQPAVSEIQEQPDAFVAVLRRLHEHAGFREAASSGGRALEDGSPASWIREESARLQGIAPADVRVRRAAAWRERFDSSLRDAQDNSILVAGHGDAHRGNWRLTADGPALIDWEEMRIWPLASELADFIVFAGLNPRDVAEGYGAPDWYVPAIEQAVAASALSFCLYWLRTLIDGSDPRPEDLAVAERACERLFQL